MPQNPIAIQGLVPRLSRDAFILCQYLMGRVNHQSEDKKAWPSYSRIERETRLRRAAILAAANWLEWLGFATLVRETQEANQYFLKLLDSEDGRDMIERSGKTQTDLGFGLLDMSGKEVEQEKSPITDKQKRLRKALTLGGQSWRAQVRI